MNEFVTIEVHEEFEKRMIETNDRQNHRLSELEAAVKEINRLTTAMERMVINIEVMTKELGKQGERLDSLENKPAERWDALISGIIGAVAGALGTGLIMAIVNAIH